MRPIENIFISCCKRDFHLARILVASIRYWYPNIPISILKDFTVGHFNTQEVQRYFNVKVIELERKKFGWSFIKMEPFFFNEDMRFFGLDADIVFVGPVLDKLNQINKDIIVHASLRDEPNIRSHYYTLSMIHQNLDPHFKYPGYIFNCGHIVGQTKMILRNDFEPLVDYNSPFPILKHPTFFSHADQGIMNYMVHKKEQDGKISVGSYPFSIWQDSPEIQEVILKDIEEKKVSSYKLIHYAGYKPYSINKMPRSDILRFYEIYYYSYIPYGFIKRHVRNTFRIAYFYIVDRLKALAPNKLVSWIKQNI